MRKKIFYTLVGLLIFTTSCKDDSLDRFDLKKITKAAILRTVSKDIKKIDVNDLANSNTSITVEFDDFNKFDSMKSVDFFAEYKDTKPGEDGKLLKKPEVKMGTLNADSFKKENGGKPRAKITYNANNVLTSLGLTSQDMDHSNIIIFRLSLNMKDGRVFSSNNVRNSVAGSSAFRTPFRYSAKVKIVRNVTLNNSAKLYNFRDNKVVSNMAKADVEYSKSVIKKNSNSDIQFLEMKFENVKEKKDREKEKTSLFNKSSFTLKLKFAFQKGNPSNEIRNPKKGSLFAYKVTRDKKVFYGLFKVGEVKDDELNISSRREQKAE